jgi:geranylgeranyl reductase family protein
VSEADVLVADVLVVGGGPAGCAVAIRLALAGHQVALVEKRAVPRHKACGDVLTPRAIEELGRLDIDPLQFGGHALDGIRMVAAGRELTQPWPTDVDSMGHESPVHAAVLRRDVLDETLRTRARECGVRVMMGHEATAPIVERGFVRGAFLDTADGSRSFSSRFVVVADGANSRFGRALGTTRERNWPYSITTRSYWNSSRTRDRHLEMWLGIPGADGTPIAGSGWVAPVGDGTVNIGVGVLSSYRDVRGLNALKLLDAFAHRLADRWEIEPDAAIKAPTRFRLPLGGSVGPTMGPTFLVVGDAAGMANPFTGDGVEPALRTGRIAAEVLDEALAGNSTSLQRYPTMLAESIGSYHHVGRLTARFIGRPSLLAPMLRIGMSNDKVMGSALRIATNQFRHSGPTERVAAVAATMAKLAPNW